VERLAASSAARSFFGRENILPTDQQTEQSRMMQDRLTEIEIRIAYVEQTVNELSDVLVRQQAYIYRLERGFERLNEKLQAEKEIQADGDPEAERPPHY
jgi:SlyX protein